MILTLLLVYETGQCAIRFCQRGVVKFRFRFELRRRLLASWTELVYLTDRSGRFIQAWTTLYRRTKCKLVKHGDPNSKRWHQAELKPPLKPVNRLLHDKISVYFPFITHRRKSNQPRIDLIWLIFSLRN